MIVKASVWLIIYDSVINLPWRDEDFVDELEEVTRICNPFHL